MLKSAIVEANVSDIAIVYPSKFSDFDEVDLIELAHKYKDKDGVSAIDKAVEKISKELGVLKYKKKHIDFFEKDFFLIPYFKWQQKRIGKENYKDISIEIIDRTKRVVVEGKSYPSLKIYSDIIPKDYNPVYHANKFNVLAFYEKDKYYYVQSFFELSDKLTTEDVFVEHKEQKKVKGFISSSILLFGGKTVNFISLNIPFQHPKKPSLHFIARIKFQIVPEKLYKNKVEYKKHLKAAKKLDEAFEEPLGYNIFKPYEYKSKILNNNIKNWILGENNSAFLC